ncbi:MAG: hypothetical protein K2L98_01640 [Bacilli bacterium]|nr:hypothetical protein [Bacilli bacterium]
MIEKLKNKYVFFDVDGTLSEYRYNDSIYSGRDPELGCQTLKNLLFDDLFANARPLKTMQRVISELDSDKVLILGTAVTNNEIEQKYPWFKKHYPNIKREKIKFCSSPMLKPDVIVEWCKHFNVAISDVAFVDDRLDVLRRAEEMGITSYHPSSFTE